MGIFCGACCWMYCEDNAPLVEGTWGATPLDCIVSVFEDFEEDCSTGTEVVDDSAGASVAGG